jgi:hypothetical protein
VPKEASAQGQCPKPGLKDRAFGTLPCTLVLGPSLTLVRARTGQGQGSLQIKFLLAFLIGFNECSCLFKIELSQPYSDDCD